MADENLSEEQIQKLLEDAKTRLESKPGGTNHQDTPICLKHSNMILAPTMSIKPYINGTKSTPKVHMSHCISMEEKKSCKEACKVLDPVMTKNKIDPDKRVTTGPDWYNLPRTNLTPELKRDLQLLHMRDVLDPKRHYKKDNMRNIFPEFSQVGTIIEGPTEYLSGRLTKKQRKQTLVEEILGTENVTGRFKKKYNEIQASNASGKKAHYTKLKRMRTRNKEFKT